MRLFLLENYESKEFPEWHTDEMVERVRSDCSKFISEFVERGHYVYRGLDDLSEHKAYLIPTRDCRLAHGQLFKNSQLALSFDKYLEQNNIGSRYRYSVSTTSTDPEEYHGVIVDSWYYFIPRGNYQYHYHKGVQSDLNMSTEGSEIGQMRVVNNAISKIISAYEQLEDGEIFNIDDSSPMLLVYDEDVLKSIFRDLGELYSILPNLFQDKNYNKVDKMIGKLFEPVDTLAKAFYRSKDPDMQYAARYFTMMSKSMSVLKDAGVSMTVFYFLKTVVGNEQNEHMSDNEIVFTCKSYYVIPHDEDGKAFMRRLAE